ncbi:MAG: phospholipase D family protein [Planctomycetaceae bacterium]|nr:phospholipase D family protein [Planctomycetaceae bacterium]
MAKFLNTSATNYFLEELIKSARDRLILISPFLQTNQRIRELLEDKNRLKIDVRVVYGKHALHPEEISWLSDLTYIRRSFCRNLHAKCYLNEEQCIITSLNLYQFSQVNNHEMGVLISRDIDRDVYQEAYDEAQRIIRMSEEDSVESVVSESEISPLAQTDSAQDNVDEGTRDGKLSTSKMAAQIGMKTADLVAKLILEGYLATRNGGHYLTEKGKTAGGEFRKSRKYGVYFLWPESLKLQ